MRRWYGQKSFEAKLWLAIGGLFAKPCFMSSLSFAHNLLLKDAIVL
jgi:hypothetical protein